MVYESKRPENTSSWNTPSQSHWQSSPSKKHDSFGHRTHKSDPEREAFEQNRSEAVLLEIKEKDGTITQVEKERLAFLRQQMSAYWDRRFPKSDPNWLEKELARFDKLQELKRTQEQQKAAAKTQVTPVVPQNEQAQQATLETSAGLGQASNQEEIALSQIQTTPIAKPQQELNREQRDFVRSGKKSAFTQCAAGIAKNQLQYKKVFITFS
ncbi:hypothetical protein A6770_21975 [Nostoc minutum NIES-26]|uniref:Uncharacterized protein n=1 Tax=Nostoc minutum NIES-26 TaxID=1844469 RepID=A0A367R1D3_9NOSO|nr:hypothetical protein A6770_21975 [Nostoc minutum NIES-26]